MNLGWELTLPLWHLLPSDLETVTIAALLQHKAPWEAGMRRECLGGWLAVMWGINTVCWAMVQCQRHEIPDLPNPTKLKPSALHYEGIIHLLMIHQLLVYEQPWVETYILLSSYPQLLIGCLAFTSCSLMTTRESIPKWIWVFSCSGITLSQTTLRCAPSMLWRNCHPVLCYTSAFVLLSRVTFFIIFLYFFSCW